MRGNRGPPRNASIKLPAFGPAHPAASERFYLDPFLGETIPPFAADCFSFRAESFRRLFIKTEIATLLRKVVVQHADARGLVDGLIWPKTGFASIV
ncbi:hypothetical protein [Bradyrhizobium centrosematis]|uniref:hypothetical protein n=1 Tax=Bradyrhizobium centrosematis TaxID=1300039 RepID=UPI003890FC9F